MLLAAPAARHALPGCDISHIGDLSVWSQWSQLVAAAALTYIIAHLPACLARQSFTTKSSPKIWELQVLHDDVSCLAGA